MTYWQKTAQLDASSVTADIAERLASILRRMQNLQPSFDQLHYDAIVLADAIEDSPTLPVDNRSATEDHEPMTDLTRQEVDAKLAASEAKVDVRLANFDASIKAGFAEMRAEFAAVRTEMSQARVDMHKGTAEIIKWVAGTAIGVLVLGATVMTFVLNNAAPKATASPSAPIIIALPAGASVPSPAPPQAPAK